MPGAPKSERYEWRCTSQRSKPQPYFRPKYSILYTLYFSLYHSKLSPFPRRFGRTHFTRKKASHFAFRAKRIQHLTAQEAYLKQHTWKDNLIEQNSVNDHLRSSKGEKFYEVWWPPSCECGSNQLLRHVHHLEITKRKWFDKPQRTQDR